MTATPPAVDRGTWPGEPGYLRYPHVAHDLITFAAEDDVWLASLSDAADGCGSRAWRLTADQVPVLHPRLNPSATHVAWTSARDGSRSLAGGTAREAYAVPTGGGSVSRLTYWGDRFATVRGWVSDHEVVVLSRNPAAVDAGRGVGWDGVSPGP